MKIRLSIKRPYGEIIVEGDNLDEVVNNLRTAPEWITILDRLVLSSETPTSRKEFLEKIVEFTNDGPVVVVAKERLSDKEAICLTLYASDPNALEPKEIARLLTISGRLSAGFGARLSELRNEGLVMKESTGAYKLTASGRQITEELVGRFKQ